MDISLREEGETKSSGTVCRLKRCFNLCLLVRCKDSLSNAKNFLRIQSAVGFHFDAFDKVCEGLSPLCGCNSVVGPDKRGGDL